MQTSAATTAPSGATSAEDAARRPMAELLELIQRQMPGIDTGLIERAYDFAAAAHRDQRRKSGEPYIIHPINTARILAEMQLDAETIAAGLLHDVIEDTGADANELTEQFGGRVAKLVEG
ncbi:MAG: HD domain-containing protein, partial [Chloroflexota bacterium]|nr:HD domain-containing protein [Chloroflexota bacterium]